MTTSEVTGNPAQETAAVPEKSGRRADSYIWAIFIVLCIVAVVELYSASSFEVKSDNVFGPLLRHGIMLIAGTGIAYGLSRIPYRWFIPMIPVFVCISIGLMLWVLVKGEIVNGARRSFDLLGIAIQPAEFLKLSVVLTIALIMSRTQIKGGGISDKGIVATALAVLMFGGLLFTQGLTNTILLMAISLSMMLIAGIQWKKFFLVLLAYGVAAGCGVLYKSKAGDDRKQLEMTEVAAAKGEIIPSRMSTWQARISRYLGTNDSIPKHKQPITAENRQEMFSYIAQANGGAFGVLPGNSREAARVPLAFSDYIFAIIVEDLGFFGGFVLMIVYLSLLARAGNIASRCARVFPALLVMGMAVMIVFQALFHMAIVTGVFPVSGQPLPLISKGGSSILITSIAFGIMLSVSAFAVRSGKRKEIKEEMEALPEEVRAENPTQV